MGYESNFTEKIYDNVYGFIYLTKEEKELLSTPYFQRLNHIRQLGLAYFVFPGAVHTRFSHSLGVLHIAEKMFQQLKKTGYIEKNSEIIDKHHKILRLAALLHDIGHYPISHTIEASYRECSYIIDRHCPNDALINEFNGEYPENTNIAIGKKFKQCLNSNNLNDLFFYDKSFQEYDDIYHHENLAGRIIRNKKFSELLQNKFKIDEDDIEIICSLINGKGIKREYYVLSKIIKSNLDADQIDYMIRDTKNTGISVNIDVDFIINNMMLVKKTDRYYIAYSYKAISAIEQFLLSKYYWYSNILYYEKSYIINFVARRLYSYLLNYSTNMKYSNIKKIEGIINNPEEFVFFNDSYFWNQIENILNNKEFPDVIKRLAKMLINKTFPKLIKEKSFEEKINNAGLQNLGIHYQASIDAKETFNYIKNSFKEAFKAQKNLVPIPINRQIVNVKTNSLGEFYGKSSKDPLTEEDQELKRRESYINDDNIYITYDKNDISVITHNKFKQNQLFGLFYTEKGTPKSINIYRLYDFSEI